MRFLIFPKKFYSRFAIFTKNVLAKDVNTEDRKCRDLIPTVRTVQYSTVFSEMGWEYDTLVPAAIRQSADCVTLHSRRRAAGHVSLTKN